MKNLTGNINASFKDLIASFDFVQFSLKNDIGTTNYGAIALEMAELQADKEARINFRSLSGYNEVVDRVTK